MMSSTPSSAASPANIAPTPILAAKTSNADSMATTLETAIPVSGIGPTKNWVIPPRPKPGRKPATDTPPTKRKAQNRAAQRAFRERRAARVGELEEQLKETEEERQKRESAMHNQIALQTDKISKLEEDVQRFSEEANTWRLRYFELQQRLEDESVEKNAAVMELAYLRNGSRATGTNAVPLPRRQQNPQRSQPASITQNENTTLGNEALGCGGCTATNNCACLETAMTIATSGCGKCTADSHCECLDETLKAADMDITMEHDLKRPFSTTPASDDIKRPRFSIDQAPQQEIDFTAQFSQARPRLMRHRSSHDHLIPSSTRAPTESCGFCAEGTYCACAEAAGAPNAIIEADHENRLAPLLNEVTPPPSDTDGNSPDVHGFKLPPLHPNHQIHHPLQSGSDNTTIIPDLLSVPAKQSYSGEPTPKGPGSCKQCQEDPKSGLFCRSLAAIRASNGSMKETSGSCCGGLNAAGGGCSRNQDSSSTLTLSCADTYKTLAIHKNFDQASDSIDDWLPKLHASLPRQTGRAPLDIEAASVMNVLKYFDVRFGRS